MSHVLLLKRVRRFEVLSVPRPSLAVSELRVAAPLTLDPLRLKFPRHATSRPSVCAPYEVRRTLGAGRVFTQGCRSQRRVTWRRRPRIPSFPIAASRQMSKPVDLGVVRVVSAQTRRHRRTAAASRRNELTVTEPRPRVLQMPRGGGVGEFAKCSGARTTLKRDTSQLLPPAAGRPFRGVMLRPPQPERRQPLGCLILGWPISRTSSRRASSFRWICATAIRRGPRADGNGQARNVDLKAAVDDLNRPSYQP